MNSTLLYLWNATVSIRSSIVVVPWITDGTMHISFMIPMLHQSPACCVYYVSKVDLSCEATLTRRSDMLRRCAEE